VYSVWLLHHLASPHILLGGVYSTAEKLDSICIPVGSLGDITGPTPFNNNANINREFNYLTIWCLPGVPGENNQSAAGGSRSNRPQAKSTPIQIGPKSNRPQIKSLYYYVFLFNLICIVNCVVYLIPNQIFILLCCLFNLIISP
jgi:hypothetical protein